MVRFRDLEDVKAELRRKGFNSRILSERTGVPQSTIRTALVSKGCPRGEKVIAKALQLPLHVVFPDRWKADGQRKINKRRSQHKANPARTHRPIARVV